MKWRERQEERRYLVWNDEQGLIEERRKGEGREGILIKERYGFR